MTNDISKENKSMSQVNAWVNFAARVCHEANRAIQIQTGDPAPSPPWSSAPAWQKESAQEGVANAVKGMTAEDLHHSWCMSKWDDGWVYGEVKDADKKTHPCLVPYSELPAEQKLKDHVFSSIVGAFMDAVLLTVHNLEEY